MIYVYDTKQIQDAQGVSLRKKVKLACQTLFADAGATVLERTRNICTYSTRSAALVVAHADTNTSNLIENMRDGSVCIWVSTQGVLSSPRLNRGIFELSLHPRAQDITKEEWSFIINNLLENKDHARRDVLECLIEGGNPEGLRPYFDEVEAPLLAALAILLQGFLALNAPEALGAPHSEDLRTPAVKELGPDYWSCLSSPPLGTRLRASVERAFELEWRSLRPGPLPEPIAVLARAIEDAAPQRITPELAAEALGSLKEVL